MEQPIIAEESFYQRMDKIYEWEDRGAFTTRYAQATKNTRLRALCAFVFYWVGGYGVFRQRRRIGRGLFFALRVVEC